MKTDTLGQGTPGHRPRHLVNTGAEWCVDLHAGTVLHESGLVISVSRVHHATRNHSPVRNMTWLGMCWAPQGCTMWALRADTAALCDTLAAFDVSDGGLASPFVVALTEGARQAWLRRWLQTPNAARARRVPVRTQATDANPELAPV